MASIVYLILAAFCNAVMDVTLFHYHKSIFMGMNGKWWDGSRSWENKYVDYYLYGKKRKKKWGIVVPVQLTDAFHYFKMWMIIFMVLAVTNYTGIVVPFLDLPECSAGNIWCKLYTYLLRPDVYTKIMDILILGLIWNSTFTLFYDTILIKKKHRNNK